ncbi:DUF4385 domain-containing protein [Chitinophaga rhizophila]|uniref:DUF4385 domain-containing protein n=1 Tax=Chitinophaga rhizophila TaxID=2866212 RepID=A0ABS7GAF9_9BACT|nr:DUF4385 domain-containing protein [Chitinophaga rhizophila]MBW8684639.1 DUF4385 domain-containing protein [Chitinophaga rhizophila]
MSKTRRPSYLNFDGKSYSWKRGIDYRKHPEMYKVGKGEQGVLICEPYKSEIGQYWRFKDPETAAASSEKIYALFEEYLTQDDFVGADMARKYLQMGFTRARRYANYKGGIKYQKDNDYKLNERGTGEEAKAVAAQIFYDKYKLAERHPTYKDLKADWKARLG